MILPELPDGGDGARKTHAGTKKERDMANILLPIEERTLTPNEVELLDRRRRRGQLFLVICVMCLLVGTLVTMWAGQDATYSPGWARPMVYWDALMFLLAAMFGLAGLRLRRGSTEFFSY